MHRKGKVKNLVRKIYMYYSEGNESVNDFIIKSNPKIKKKYEFLLRLIADEKNQLKEPYVKHFTIERFKQLYELRLKAAKTMIRIIYYKAEENIILLYAFNKKDKRDTEHALEYALKIVKSLDNKALNPFEKLMEVNIH